MSRFAERHKHFFPLNSIKSVLGLFETELSQKEEPDLALLSIILGAVENILTVNRALPNHLEDAANLEPIFPVVDLQTVDTLYSKFVRFIKDSVDLSDYEKDYATRDLIKKVSDVIWSTLTRSVYKDKAHLQSLYSFLTGNKLDCFGVAFSLVAACQLLGFKDVHLALSEDHAWVVFGECGSETAEVTWHGKGNEDKRGQPINVGVAEKSWLYLNGHPVVCTRCTEVAAIVSSINPTINACTDSVEMGSLQQELLWLLYDKGYLKKYPMAIGNLGDCEEIAPTPGRPSSLQLFKEAIQSSVTHYDNQHVYPYTYLGGFLYRKGLYKAALKSWAQAADVVRNYNYNREDEEVYKEFLEIANELIPQIIRNSHDSLQLDELPTNNNKSEDLKVSPVSSDELSFLRDPECYQLLLLFYDGICEWEEGSPTSILHSFWAKHFVQSLSKFDPRTRTQFEVVVGEEDKSGELEGCDEQIPVKPRLKKAKKFKHDRDEEEMVIRHAIEELEHRVKGATESVTDAPNPTITALAHACSDSILNPDFLLGCGEPFKMGRQSPASDRVVDVNEFLSSNARSSPFPGLTMDSVLKAETPVEMKMAKSERASEHGSLVEANVDSCGPITLRSEKMKGMKDLLLAEKLNASAIKLQLTAQSQVHVKHTKPGDSDWDTEGFVARKRHRRE